MSAPRDMCSRVYFAQCNFGGPIKVGCSMDIPSRIYMQNAEIPFDLVMIGSVPGGLFREAYIHCWFRSSRIRREWFKPVPELMRWAMQARSRNNIYGLPADLHRSYRAETRSLLRMSRYHNVSLIAVAEAAGYKPEYLEFRLKDRYQGTFRVLAAFAVAYARRGLILDFDSASVSPGVIDHALSLTPANQGEAA